MGLKITKAMRRKGSKYGKGSKDSRQEKEHLLKVGDNEDSALLENTESLNVPKNQNLTPRKKSIWAPAATATQFEDVPVYTICPYCSQKCVTKTHFKRGRKHWFCCCCCLPYFLDFFKDVIHSCPKCSRQIAIYNRFYFFKKDNDSVNNNSAEETGEKKTNNDNEDQEQE